MDTQTNTPGLRARMRKTLRDLLAAGALSLLGLAPALAQEGPRVVIEESGGSTRVSENGAHDTYTIFLSEKPNANVTVRVSITPNPAVGAADATDLEIEPQEFSFNDENYDTPQTVDVTAVDDNVPEGTEQAELSHNMVSTDSRFNTPNPEDQPQVMVVITDNDRGSVDIVESGGSTSVTEGGPPDHYEVSLTTQPAADVTITITTERERRAQSAQITLGPRTLVFTEDDYNVPQPVTVEAVNDAQVEDEKDETIHHAVTSSDTAYNLFNADPVTVEIYDDDSAGIVLQETAGVTQVTEGGSPDSYCVKLLTQPGSTSNVTVTAAPEQRDQLSVTPPTLVFRSSDWSQLQCFTVSAIDDSAVEGIHSSSVSHSVASNEGAYNNMPLRGVTVMITDNDVAAVLVSEQGDTTVVEGGASDTYAVVLSRRPEAPVTVTVKASDQLTVTPSVLRFQASNYDDPQSVVVQAKDDDVVEDPLWATIRHDVASGDPGYNGYRANNVSVWVLDDDMPTVRLEQTGGSTRVVEGGDGDLYYASLTARPTSDVFVSPVDYTIELQTNIRELRFSPQNYAERQPVWVYSANDDNRASGTRRVPLLHEVRSADERFEGMVVQPLEVEVIDNDIPGVRILESEGSTGAREGENPHQGQAPDYYDIHLATQPDRDVTITLVPSAQLELSRTSLTFTPANYRLLQAVQVWARDDKVVEGDHVGHILHRATSDDAFYRDIAIGDVAVLITDDDFQEVILDESNGATTVIEGGAGDSYFVSLAAQPLADVTITLSESSGGVTVSPSVLHFTPENFEEPQSVEVIAVDDDVASGSRTASIVSEVESEDLGYHQLGVRSIDVQITDNDVPMITITESMGGTWVTEGGADDPYWLNITTRPTSEVVVEIIASDQIVANPTVIRFTPDNFGTPQRVTLTAVDDRKIEGPEEVLVSHRVTSADTNYQGIPVRDLTVNIIDNDLKPKKRSLWSGGATGAGFLTFLAAAALARRRSRTLLIR